MSPHDGPSHTADPTTQRYLEARRVWGDEMAELALARRQWQRMAMGCLVLAILSVAGVVGMALRHDVIPYVVELDARQNIVRTYPAEPMRAPSAQYTRAALAKWVRFWRGVTVDTYVIQDQIALVFAMLRSGSAAEKRLIEWFRDNSPYERATSFLVHIEVTNLLAISDSTWRVDWLETTRHRNGDQVSQEAFSANITVAQGQPEAETILLNPTGLFIEYIDWEEGRPVE